MVGDEELATVLPLLARLAEVYEAPGRRLRWLQNLSFVMTHLPVAVSP
jgi:hypothetical protein